MIILALSVLIWVGLLVFRGGFWRADQRLDPGAGLAAWPEVAVVIPARDEAETIGAVLEAHGQTDYPGRMVVVVVDDSSSDGTGDIARGIDCPRAIHVIDAPPMPSGWTGKLWALHTGVGVLGDLAPDATHILLTDADIRHAPGAMRALVAKAAEGPALVSMMARLDARGLWGRLLIPAFVFFFQKLYPFPLVNDPAGRIAGAAGGCILLRRDVLEQIGGIAAIRGALIDDCTLAARVKAAGPPIWLGLARDEVVSLRDNRPIGAIWKMVARTAFTQLRHSPLLLAGSTLGMALVYLAGPCGALLGVVGGEPRIVLFGIVCWGLMAIAYRPTARLYGQPWWHSLTLPLAACLYMAMTLDSAFRHWRGKGGAWKGRTYSGD